MDKRVPEVRFKGFTDDWELRKLGETSKITMGQSPNSINYTSNPNDPILVQGNADIKNGKVSPRVWTTQITKTAQSGDFILSVRAPVGDVGKTDYDVVLGRGVAGIQGTEFIYQILIKMKLFNYWGKLVTGSTFESINSNDIQNAEINIPKSLNEQKHIGNFLKHVDSLIKLQIVQLSLYESMKKGMIQKIFSLNDKGIPKIRSVHFGGEWIQRKLGKIGDFSKSNIDPRKTPDAIFYEYSMPAYDNGKHPSIVLGKTMQSNRIRISGTVLLINKLNVRQKRIWLVEKAGINSVASSEFMPFTSSIIDLSFLKQKMLSNNITRNLESISSGTSNSQKRITPSDILKYKIEFPSDKREQAEIGQLLKKVDNIMILERKNIDNLKIIKMYYLKKIICIT
ncbi:restriction endonuclease subunit S [Companilactobacillus huachuanensis]|uniref:Restriction endonuclease subunit S n=1 Tax=Companilactobacillus huachuanensis TaxID=2559914 RepID=A0ABW1RNG2_9LACO|nr:restriction endonuclease subunit S [Companilactobacillus huachuanensis]